MEYVTFVSNHLEMQTILGAGRAVGKALAKALTEHTDRIRLVSRNPKKVNDSDELFAADLLNAESVSKAVEGSEVDYLCAGLEYKVKVWRASWPVIMQNVIRACKEHKSKLVFFDNIYMYDPNYLGDMTEETPHRPVSKKGAVRKELIEMLRAEMDKGELEVLIARSADFYGPGVKLVSVLSQTVIENLAAGKQAQVMGDPSKKHAYTYIPDAGKATALLGNTDNAFGQTWHLPTAGNPPTHQEWVEKFAAAFGTKPKYMKVGKGMLSVLGLFIPVMKELSEMQYQNETDYVLNSRKFEQRFGISPTPYDEGIRAIVEADYPR